MWFQVRGRIMLELSDVKDRAMALNLESGFIDEDKCLSYDNGDLIFHLNTFVVKNPDVLKIEIPEGIDGVFAWAGDTVYKDYAHYEFIFPSTCRYVYKDIIAEGRITLDSGYFYLASERNETFKNSIFDFRKCRKLNSLHDSFNSIEVKEVLFADELACCYKSFTNFKAERLYAPGLGSVRTDSFRQSIIKDLTLGEQSRFEVTGFTFGDSVVHKELVFRDIECANKRAFKNVKDVYIEYKLDRGLSQLHDFLVKQINDIKEDKTDMLSLLFSVGSLNSVIKEHTGDYEILCNIEHAIFKIKQWVTDEENRDDWESWEHLCGELIRYSKQLYVKDEEGGRNVYYFKSDSHIDVHKRKYERIGVKNDLTVYLEL